MLGMARHWLMVLCSAGVHAPVPFYDQIAKPMINVFGRGLKVGRPLERFNWAITDDPALFQVGGLVSKTPAYTGG